MTQASLFDDEGARRDAVWQAVEAAWRKLEQLHGTRRARLKCDAVVVDGARITVCLFVDGRKHAVVGRADVDTAARDLFTQVHGAGR